VDPMTWHNGAMPSRRGLLVLAAALVAFAAALVLVNRLEPTAAAQEVSSTAGFMQIYGVNGESDDSLHQNWSDILSFEQGKSRMAATVDVVKTIDAASVKVEQAWIAGTKFKRVYLDLTDPMRGSFYFIMLVNATVTKYQAHAESGGQALEAFQFKFQRMEVRYLPPEGPWIITTWVRPST
jgi:type VI protein secretion system component Hcp